MQMPTTTETASSNSIFELCLNDFVQIGQIQPFMDFGNPICKFVRLSRNNNKDVSMLVCRFLFLLIFKSEHSCLGSENWVRILSGGLLPREFTANTAFSGTSMPSRIKSSWEFQPHTLIGQIQPLMDLAIPFVNLFGYPGTTTKMCPCLFPGFFFC